jgi:hypothetical protein
LKVVLPSPGRGLIQGLVVKKDHSGHAYVVFSGFSRRWTSTFDSGEGHVYETANGGGSSTDISGNLPDAPGDDLVLTPSAKLVVASDIGVFYSASSHGGTWYRFGTGLSDGIDERSAAEPERQLHHRGDAWSWHLEDRKAVTRRPRQNRGGPGGGAASLFSIPQ